MKLCFQSFGLLPHKHFWTGRGYDLGLDFGTEYHSTSRLPAYGCRATSFTEIIITSVTDPLEITHAVLPDLSVMRLLNIAFLEAHVTEEQIIS